MKSIAKSYFKGTHTFLIVFDISWKETFNEASQWIKDIKDYNDSEDVVIYLIGNKCDRE